MASVSETCEKAVASLNKIMQLRQDCEGNRIIHFRKRAPSAKKLLDYLFTQPVLTPQQIAEILGVSLVTAYKLIDDFIESGILKPTTEFKRNRFFIFKDYVDLFI